ncbi:MAG: hypothetical protein HY063_09725 [Bacteroidetes bacterium]|nr:hypothetical protein [Bacteroidota bacterium]
MKTKHLIFSGTILLFAAALSFTGCRKENTKDNDTSGAEDNALADKNFEDMHQASNEAASGGLSSFKGSDNSVILSGCATITPDTANKKFTIDFGSSPCQCKDLRYRQGKIYVSWSGLKPYPKYWDSLTTITITTNPTDNYYVGNSSSAMNHVTGTRTVINKGHNTAHHMNWDVTDNGTVTKASGGTITWQSNRNREWIQGEVTPPTPVYWPNCIFGITGSASGVSAKGVQFSVNITSELIRDLSCGKHFVKGTVDFTPGSKPVRHVDFGYCDATKSSSGCCDDWVSITVNSTTVYKQLP